MEREKIENKITRLAGGWKFDEIKTRQPFDQNVMEFLEELSKEICMNEKTAVSIEARSFAFWCRKNHLIRWKVERKNGEYPRGIGMIFHIAPSNIPLLFAYSMVFGMLSGNGNVIRISQRTVGESKDLCEVIDQVMRKDKYKDIYESQLIMTYEKDDEITKEISQICDGRVIWGGDETVQKMRQYPLKIGAAELTFPDRNSIAVFDLVYMKQASYREKEDLAYRFYNDTLLMDQNACSSPRLIYWLNETEILEDESNKIKKEWWDIFSKISKIYDLSPWKVSKKYEQICSEVMEFHEISKVTKYGENLIYVSQMKDIPEKTSHYQGKFGCFYEYEIKNLNKLCKILDRKVQTIVYEGTDPEELAAEIIRAGVKGADRIVKAGSALELDRIWDGKDVIASLSRIIQIK